jgi:hypothetical protein
MSISGYRTYIAGALIIVHQLLKLAGADIAEKDLSIAIDVLLAIGVVIFRKLGKKKEV